MKDGPRNHDFEPVVIYKDADYFTPASRYHWYLMTIWRDAVKVENKNNLTFSDEYHTPLVQSTAYTSWLVYFSIKPDEISPLRTRMKNTARKLAAGTLYGGFQIVLLDEVSRKFKRQIPSYLITSDKFDEKYLFDLNNFVGGALIGEKKEIPKQVLDKLTIKYDLS